MRFLLFSPISHAIMPYSISTICLQNTSADVALRESVGIIGIFQKNLFDFPSLESHTDWSP